MNRGTRAKCSLFLLNSVILVLTTTLGLTATFTLVTLSVDEIPKPSIWTIPLLSVAITCVVVLLLCLFGFDGVIRANRFCLSVCMTLVLFAGIGQIMVGTYVISSQDAVADSLAKEMNARFPRSANHTSAPPAWRNFQKEVLNFVCQILPSTYCSSSTESCSFPENWEKGCDSNVPKFLILFTGTVIGVGVVEVVWSFVSVFLIGDIDRRRFEELYTSRSI